MGLTSSELSDMRSMADDWLPDTCTIQAATEGVDALGGGSLSWADTYTAVSCRVAPIRQGQEGVSSYALQGRSAWVLSVAYDQALTVEDRITYGGDTYEVESVEDDHSNRTLRRAIVVRVD